MSTSRPVSLVTGGAGFMGAHVVHELIGLGHRVVVLDDLSGGFRENVDPGAEFVLGSIEDVPLLSSLFAAHPFDYVYHLAAYAAEGLSPFIRRFNYRNNLVGSVNLINEAVAHEVKCFVFTSSIAVYGSQKPPMREDMPLAPADPYGIAKAAVEQDLRAAHDTFGLNFIVFRPHNVYGEYQNIGDRYRNVVGIFMNQLLQRRPLTVFGDGTQTRAFTYIGDVAPCLARSVTVPGVYNEVINIGGDDVCSVNDLATAAMEALGMPGDVRHLPARHEVAHAFADHAKARRLLPTRAQTPLPVGLSRMARWVRKVGARRSRPFAGIEIMKGLPEAWLDG
jgi:UDP-glucose 4-epimerase